MLDFSDPLLKPRIYLSVCIVASSLDPAVPFMEFDTVFRCLAVRSPGTEQKAVLLGTVKPDLIINFISCACFY